MISEKVQPKVEQLSRGEYSSSRILLVEDNLVNQAVSRAMLEYFGCRMDAVGNGREALEAIAGAHYDLILMDCQMPLMDGYEATRAIREREAFGDRRIPIVALTAHAMEGDREICLEAGMDDYLSKPYKPEELHSVLIRWLGPASDRGEEGQKGTEARLAPFPHAGGEEETKECPPGRQPIDAKALAAIRALDVKGTGHILEKVVRMFFDSSPVLLSAMHEAAVADDRDALSRAAHTLKSASANLGALPLSYLCREMEMQSRTGKVESAASLIADIEAEYARALAALEREVERRV